MYRNVYVYMKSAYIQQGNASMKQPVNFRVALNCDDALYKWVTIKAGLTGMVCPGLATSSSRWSLHFLVQHQEFLPCHQRKNNGSKYVPTFLNEQI